VIRRILFAAVAVGLVACAAYAAFYVAPEERTMGAIQRIFYLHASSAWAGETTFFFCFVANLLYIWRRKPQYDWLGVTCAEVGVAFITVVLLTGPIWAKPVWGIWWTWDARLTSTFVLWILYICYLLLRTLLDEPERRALLSALFGVFAFIDVMRKVFFFNVLAMHILALFLIAERYLLEKSKHDAELLRREAEAR